MRGVRVIKNIPLDQFGKANFVVREQGSGTRFATERFFALHDVKFNTGIEMTSNEAIKQVVEAGLGLAIVSIHTLELELETNRIRILDVEGFPIRRQWYILQRKGKWLSPAALAFKAFVMDGASQFIHLPE